MTKNYKTWIKHLKVNVLSDIKFKSKAAPPVCVCDAPEPDNILEVYYSKPPNTAAVVGGLCRFRLPFNHDKFPEFGFKDFSFHWEHQQSYVVEWIQMWICAEGRSYFLPLRYTPAFLNAVFYIKLPKGTYDISFRHFSRFAGLRTYAYRLLSTKDFKTETFTFSYNLIGYITNTITYYHTGDLLEMYFRLVPEIYWGGITIRPLKIDIDINYDLNENPQQLYGDLINTKQQSINEVGAIAGTYITADFLKTQAGGTIRKIQEMFK